MHRAFVKFCKRLKPQVVILNGDVIDGATVSRHPPIGWTHLPTLEGEIKVAQYRLAEIEGAAGKARKIWTAGNHDLRFETCLAGGSHQYRGVFGTALHHHFPQWEPCWDVWVNGVAAIKHRWSGGKHAPYNNALKSGMTILTNHLHSQKIEPVTDYTGDRWGVDTGCLADPEHAAFRDYTENSPKDWRPGFCVLTFKAGKLLPPELVSRWDKNSVVFRGEVIRA
jgi:hypothetical protein